MALALEDADAIIAAAETAGVSLLAMPFDQLRTLTETKRIIQEGRIGRPVSFQATALHNGTNHSPWFYRRGGGVLSDLAIYPISWITGLVEQPRVSAPFLQWSYQNEPCLMGPSRHVRWKTTLS
jgi:predicted dehydrogenase